MLRLWQKYFDLIHCNGLVVLFSLRLFRVAKFHVGNRQTYLSQPHNPRPLRLWGRRGRPGWTSKYGPLDSTKEIPTKKQFKINLDVFDENGTFSPLYLTPPKSEVGLRGLCGGCCCCCCCVGLRGLRLSSSCSISLSLSEGSISTRPPCCCCGLPRSPTKKITYNNRFHNNLLTCIRSLLCSSSSEDEDDDEASPLVLGLEGEAVVLERAINFLIYSGIKYRGGLF